MGITKRKTIPLRAVLALLMAVLGSSGAWAANGTISGFGTQADPYLLEDLDDWTEFSNAEHAASY